jgi:hypothetical protein
LADEALSAVIDAARAYDAGWRCSVRHGSVVGEIISASLPAAWAAGKIMGRISI